MSGDADAWRGLIDKYKNLIYSIAIGYGATQADADDIFQAVCLELYNGLPALRRAESLQAWLSSVARHRSFHWRRSATRRAVREGTPLDDAAPASIEHTEHDVLERAQRDQSVLTSLDGLPPRCRRLLHLLFFEQPPRPYAAIAREMGLALGSVAVIRSRCLRKLQKALEKGRA